MTCEHVHKDAPYNAVCEDCHYDRSKKHCQETDSAASNLARENGPQRKRPDIHRPQETPQLQMGIEGSSPSGALPEGNNILARIEKRLLEEFPYPFNESIKDIAMLMKETVVIQSIVQQVKRESKIEMLDAVKQFIVSDPIKVYSKDENDLRIITDALTIERERILEELATWRENL